jgi:TnpA family transposase
MCRLLGFLFAPRIRDLKEKRLYLFPSMKVPPELAALVAGAINLRVITDHWSELLRLATSIKTGTVTASVILRKLAAYPRQNGLALALRELEEVGADTVYAAMAAKPRTASSQPCRSQQG